MKKQTKTLLMVGGGLVVAYLIYKSATKTKTTETTSFANATGECDCMNTKMKNGSKYYCCKGNKQGEYVTSATNSVTNCSNCPTKPRFSLPHMSISNRMK
jgi:hypothetical protein